MIICLHLFKEDHSLVQRRFTEKSKVRLSWMVEELIDLGLVKQKIYEDFRSLVEELKQEIDQVIEVKRIDLTQ